MSSLYNLYYNAKIHTMDPENPVAEAVVIDGSGIIIFAGSEKEAEGRYGSVSVKHDLGGKALYPGFTDTHLHILNKAVTARGLELDRVRSREELLSMVKNAALSADKAFVLDGRGYNEDLWPDPRPVTRRELDEAAFDVPVRLTRVCGHRAIGNTALLELAGIDGATPQVSGGVFDIETGAFSENAIPLLYPDERDGGTEKCVQLLKEGLNIAADAGLTCIHSDDFGTYGFSTETVYKSYRILEERNEMPVRVVQQCALPDKSSMEEFNRLGLKYMLGSEMYRIGPRKLYADGSLGARTAWLKQPYRDDPGNTGVPIYRQDELNELAADSHRQGMPFIVHAIGDAAVKSVLDAIEYARETVPGTDNLPDGIVHCQITGPEEIKRIADMKVSVYAQPVFTEYDLHICASRVGSELEKTSYNWKTLYDAGAVISSGSDCPVEPLDPNKNIFCAVARKDFSLIPEGGWLKEQALSLDEAIACHTCLAARAAGTEDRYGYIKRGYYADMSVFEKEFESLSPDEYKDNPPVMTFVLGKVRLCRGKA